MTEGIRLFIDDIREPSDASWLVARTSSEAIEVLATRRVIEVSFDHDLGGEDTVMRVVDWLDEQVTLDTTFPIPRWYVHSANPVGRDRIRAALQAMERRRHDAFECPVCGLAGFSEPPWDGENASFDICSSCGIQFGYNDARADFREQIHSAWRQRWMLNQQQPVRPWPSFEELLETATPRARVGPATPRLRQIEAGLAQDVEPVLRGGEYKQGWLGYLVNELLAGQEGWSSGWSIDDASVEDYALLDESSIDLWGELHVMGRGRYWNSPFRAIVRLNEARDGLADYEMWLGERGTLPGLPSNQPRPRHWPKAKEWQYHLRAE